MTMEDAMTSDAASIAVLCITFLYSGIAYYFIYTYCQAMRNFEFREVTFCDTYVSGNSVLIKGINPNLNVSEADKLVRRIFEEIYGKK